MIRCFRETVRLSAYFHTCYVQIIHSKLAKIDLTVTDRNMVNVFCLLFIYLLDKCLQYTE